MSDKNKNPKSDVDNTNPRSHIRQDGAKTHVETTENASRKDIIDKNTNERPRDQI